MTPRLMVVCLGGLAGTPICCDLGEEAEAQEAADTDIVDARADDLDAAAAEVDGAIH